MDLRRELHLLIDHVLGDDPRTALIALHRLQADELPWLEQRVVAIARRDGWTWARIARLLGRSRQSVHERFRGMQVAPRRDPLADHHRREAELVRLLRLHGRGAAPIDESIPW